MIADVFKFTEIYLLIDESIEEYEYHEYDPITGTNLNNGGNIRISIESQDGFTHPSESYLIFEGRLTKVDGTAYASADEVALTNNAIMPTIIDWLQVMRNSSSHQPSKVDFLLEFH